MVLSRLLLAGEDHLREKAQQFQSESFFFFLGNFFFKFAKINLLVLQIVIQ